MFGDDGLERMNKTLKQQLLDRDGRLAKLEGEARKNNDKVTEAVKGAEAAREKADVEELRADRAEKALKAANVELAQLRLNNSNLESRLLAERAKIAALQTEKQHLEFDLQCKTATSSNSQSVAESKLTTRLKTAEQEVQRLGSELRRAKSAQAAQAATVTPPLTDFYGKPISPARAKGGRHRASSVNATSQIKDLTFELEAARETASAAGAERESLQQQLSTIGRARDQAVNELMAFQKRTKKEIEALTDQKEDLELQLNTLTGGAGPSSNRDSKRVETLQSELNTIQARVVELERIVDEKEAEIQTLGQPSASTDNAEIRGLSHKISTLEEQLRNARSTVSEPAPVDVNVWQLQRELKAAQRRMDGKDQEIRNLTQDVQEAYTEMDSLRRISGDTTSMSTTTAVVTQLEAKIEEANDRADIEKAEAQEAVRAVETRLSEMQEELKAAQESLAAESKTLLDTRSEMETVKAQQASVNDELKVAQTAVAAAQAKVLELEAELETARARVATMEIDLSDARARATTMECESDATKETLQQAEAALTVARKQHELELLNINETSISGPSVEELSRQLVNMEQEVASLAVKAEASERLTAELIQSREETATLTTELSEMETELNQNIEELKQHLSEKEEKLSIAIADLARAQSEHKDAHKRVKKLEEEIACQPVPEALAQVGPTAAEREKKIGDLLVQLETERAKAEAVSKSAAAEVAELKATIETLMIRVATLKASEQDQEAMILKIQSLRCERDDFRSQLKFVQSERDVIENVYNSSRGKAVEELASVNAELRGKTDLCDSLQRRQDTLEAKVSELAKNASSAAAAISERESLAERLGEIKGDRDAARRAITKLESKLAELQRKHDHVTQELAEAAFTKQALCDEKSRRQNVEGQLERLIASGAPQGDEASAIYDQQQARIERRNLQIINLKSDYTNLEGNYKLAQEAAEDMIAQVGELEEANTNLTTENEELMAANSELKAGHSELSDKHSELANKYETLTTEHEALSKRHSTLGSERDTLIAQAATIGTEVEATKEQLVTTQRRLAIIESELSTTKAKIEASTDVRDLVLAVAVQRQAVAVAAKRAFLSKKALAASLDRVAALEGEQSALLEQGNGVAAIREELESTRAALAEAEAKATDYEALSTARAELEQRICTMETDYAALETKLQSIVDSHTADLSEVNRQAVEAATVNEQRAAEFTVRIESSQTEISTLTENVTALKSELEEAHEKLEASTCHASELDATATANTAEITTLRQEVSRLESALSEATDAGKKLVSRAEAAELALSKATSANESNSARTVELEQEILSSKEEQASLTVKMKELEEDLASARSAVEDANTELSQLTTTESTLRAELEVARVSLAEERNATAFARSNADSATIALEAAQREHKMVTGQLRFQEKQNKELISTLTGLREELATVSEPSVAGSASAEELKTLLGTKEELDRANSELKQTIEDLREDLQRTFASLDSKTAEVEESDDRAIELNGEIRKVRRRLDKLDRQNKALATELETLRNTRANATPERTRAAAAMPPLAQPVPKTQVSPAVAPMSARKIAASPAVAAPTPARRAFNIFEASAGTPAARPAVPSTAATPRSLKRGREDEDDRPQRTEVRVQPAPLPARAKLVTSPAIGRSPFAVRSGDNAPPERSATKSKADRLEVPGKEGPSPAVRSIFGQNRERVAR